ncbi:hypothetical protein K2P97_12065 [bacterium]|nr:hypothetical protein [bacterium]
MKLYFIGILTYLVMLPIFGISLALFYRYYPEFKYSTSLSKDLLDNFLCIVIFFIVGYSIAVSVKEKTATVAALRFSIVFGIIDFCVYLLEIYCDIDVKFLGGTGGPAWYMVVLASLDVLSCYLGAKLYSRKF